MVYCLLFIIISCILFVVYCVLPVVYCVLFINESPWPRARTPCAARSPLASAAPPRSPALFIHLLSVYRYSFVVRFICFCELFVVYDIYNHWIVYCLLRILSMIYCLLIDVERTPCAARSPLASAAPLRSPA